MGINLNSNFCQLHDFRQIFKSLWAWVNSQVMRIINNTDFMPVGRGLAGRVPGTVVKLQVLKNNSFFLPFLATHINKEIQRGRCNDIEVLAKLWISIPLFLLENTRYV